MFRPARVAVALRRLVVGLLCVVLAAPVLAAIDNALTPGISFERAATGPVLPSVVRDFAVDEATGIIYAATNAGVFRSDDGGDTWQPASRGLADVDVQNVVFDARNATLYAAVYGLGVFVSDDGATNWRDASQGIQGRQLTAIALDPHTGLLYAGTDGYGLYTSKDRAARWETAGNGLTNQVIARLTPGLQPGELFAATDRGIFHSLDAATNWEQLAATAPPTPAWSFAIDSQTGVVFAATDQGVLRFEPQGARLRLTYTGINQLRVQAVELDRRTGDLYAGTLISGVLRSTDQGATWSPLSAGLFSTRIQTLRMDASGDYVLAGSDSGVFRLKTDASEWHAARDMPVSRNVVTLQVDQTTGDVYAGAPGGGVFHSSDGGASWQPASVGLDNTLVQSLALDRSGGMIYAGTPSGVFRASLNRLQWQVSGADLAGVDVPTVIVHGHSGGLFAVTGRGDVFRSTDQGASWQLVEELRQLFARTLAVSAYSGAIYVGAFRGGVAQSLDQGFNWQPIGRGLPDPNVESLFVDERDGTLYAGTLSGGVFRAMGGGSWQRVGESLSARVLGLTFDAHSDGLLAATSAGLFRFDSQAGAWEAAGDGLSHSYILALAAHRNSGVLYAGTRGGGAFRLNSGEQTWRPVNAGLSDAAIVSLVADDRTGALFSAVTGWGVFRSDDAGRTWRTANARLPDYAVRSLALDAEDGSLWAMTGSGPVRSADQGETWAPATTTAGQAVGLVLPSSGFGYVTQTTNGEADTRQQMWSAFGGGGAWAQLATDLGLTRAAIQRAPGGEPNQSRVLSAWGADIAQSAPGSYGRVPLGWMWFRAWVWSGTAWLRANAPWWWIAVLGLVGLGLIAWLVSRASLSIRFGVPIATSVFQPKRAPQFARPQALDRAWPQWERWLKADLYRYGEVKPVDLPRIPGPLRAYALQRYYDHHSSRQLLAKQDQRISTTSGGRLQDWLRDWLALSRELKGQRFRWLKRERADRLASILADALGVRVLPARDFESVRAYGVVPASEPAPEQSSEQMSMPLPPFGLLFVSDPEPSAGTLRHLSVALRQTGESAAPQGARASDSADHIGVVIPLAKSGTQRDVAATLQRVLVQTELSWRMVVLDGDAVLDVLAARDPAEALSRHIAAAIGG